MAQTAEKVLEFPAGGIADFYMEDDEIEALGRLEAEEAYGTSGIATFPDLAERMASYGRHGDDTVAHVETGELVIPKALIEDNPRLRASIFSHLEELGVEDPERYVVGSGANSINPDTGLPEFFFRKIARAVKKTVRKVSRAVKKVAKSVVKVVKKAAPIIIPIALNVLFPGMGAIYQGALGAGIGTLVQGGSLKDAFKSALIGGAIGGAVSGVQGAMGAKAAGKTMTQGAIDNIKGAARLSNLTTAGKQLVTGQFGQSGYDSIMDAQNIADLGTVPVRETTASTFDAAKSGAGLELTGDPTTDAIIKGANRPGLPPLETTASSGKFATDGTFTGADAALADTTGAQLSEVVTPYEQPSFFESIKQGEFKEAFLPSGPTPEQVLLQKQSAYNEMYNSVKALPGATEAQASAAGLEAMKGVTAASMGPGMAGYLPLAGAGIAGATALGAFKAPEEPPQEEMQTGADLIALNPGDYRLPEETPQYAQGPTTVGTNYGIDPRTGRPIVNPFRRPSYGLPVLAAEGGEIFPRRVGGIMPDEGVPGKDSVRAMLMPGEFVMTTDAVRGLGNGNNDQGIRNMYDMMRGLEAKGRAMA